MISEHFGKSRKIIRFLKFIKNLSEAKCQVFGVFQVDLACMQSPVLEFGKNCTKNAYFLQKVDFCIFKPKYREVIENLSIHSFTLVHYNAHTWAKIQFYITRA